MMNHYLSSILATIYNRVSNIVPADTSACMYNISLKTNRPPQQNSSRSTKFLHWKSNWSVVSTIHGLFQPYNYWWLTIKKKVVQYADAWDTSLPHFLGLDVGCLILWVLFFFFCLPENFCCYFTFAKLRTRVADFFFWKVLKTHFDFYVRQSCLKYVIDIWVSKGRCAFYSHFHWILENQDAR